MTSAVTTGPARPRAVRRSAGAELDRRDRVVRRRVCLAWSLLSLNLLTFYATTWSGLPILLPIPHPVGQLITQGSLPAAVVLALSVNRRLRIRPNVFLSLVTLVVLVAVVSSLHGEGHLVGTLYRTVRFAGFTSALWLLTPWWGRRDLLLLRAQLGFMVVALATVLIGLALAPGRALAGGRLSGALWPVPPTQVADFSALTIGLVVVLWVTGSARGWVAGGTVAFGGLTLILTHSRTELIATVVGLAVASSSLFLRRARARRLLTYMTGGITIGTLTLSGLITAWLARGEKTQEIAGLSGRARVWQGIMDSPHDTFQLVFGRGLSNKSFDGLSIDSTWLAAYWDLGLLGVLLSALMLAHVLVNACLTPHPMHRALALFVVAYLGVRSYTEITVVDANIDLPVLVMAASLLAPPRHGAAGTPQRL